jgi:hypothetical protein
MAEEYSLLPSTHFGCHPGHTTTDSLHYLIKLIHDSMCKGLVVSVLFLNISGAFSNTVIPCLLHNMGMCSIPKDYTDWLKQHFDGRYTTLCFDDFSSTPFNVINGIDQGCPVSSICYGFYNVNLTDKKFLHKNELTSAFVNDAFLATRAHSIQDSYNMLQDMMMCKGGALK